MKHEHILEGLRKLSAEKPTTKMGQVRWAWREIQAALAVGHTLQFVHRRLNEVGIEIGYRTLSLYIGRLEREQALGRLEAKTAATPAKNAPMFDPIKPQRAPVNAEAGHRGDDPFSNIRREREKKKSTGFEYDAFSMNKNLLE
jgi:hypothetical protein